MDVSTVKGDSFYLDADSKLKVGLYHDQVQGQMALAGLDVTFFVVHSQDSSSTSLGDPKGQYIYEKASAKASHSF